jgi:plastocyanin
MKQSSLASILALALLGLAACDDDGGTPIDAPLIDGVSIDTPGIDAPTIDSRPSTVMVVTCPATVASEVSAPGFAFTITDATINVGDVVRFTMPGFHSAVSGPPGQPDGIFRVDFNQTACLQFTAAGSFPFYCDPHQFTATITVAGA